MLTSFNTLLDRESPKIAQITDQVAELANMPTRWSVQWSRS